MMDRTYVEAMEQVTRKPVVEDGRVFIPSGWAESKKTYPAVAPLVVHTLSGFAEYVKANRDGLPLIELVAHVKDPSRVELRSKLGVPETDWQRHTYAVASTEMVGRCALTFGQYVDAETFYIGLQTGFAETPDRELLLRLVASIRENSVRETVDSGVSQEVKTGRGVALVGSTPVPNPVTLAPYRTFREIDQPASLFVLRLREAGNADKPQVALFEADGGGWKLAAIQSTAGYLKQNLPDTVAVLA